MVCDNIYKVVPWHRCVRHASVFYTRRSFVSHVCADRWMRNWTMLHVNVLPRCGYKDAWMIETRSTPMPLQRNQPRGTRLYTCTTSTGWRGLSALLGWHCYTVYSSLVQQSYISIRLRSHVLCHGDGERNLKLCIEKVQQLRHWPSSHKSGVCYHPTTTSAVFAVAPFDFCPREDFIVLPVFRWTIISLIKLSSFVRYRCHRVSRLPLHRALLLTRVLYFKTSREFHWTGAAQCRQIFADIEPTTITRW